MCWSQSQEDAVPTYQYVCSSCEEPLEVVQSFTDDALTLCPAACLFLAMTWTSARRYWSGERSRWKNRSYETGGVG